MSILDSLTEARRRADLPWLLPETPIGVPAFTPFRVRPTSENCVFQMDAWIVRMVYFGGLGQGDDPTARTWTLFATLDRNWSGVEFPVAWRHLAPTRNSIAIFVGPSALSHREELKAIEEITQLSRRELTDWLHTSHTTLNEIAKDARRPRTSLANRITDFYRLVRRLHALHGGDTRVIQRVLLEPASGGRSAMEYALQGDSAAAASAAQNVFQTPRRLRSPQGRPNPDAVMVAVEDL